MSTDNSVKGKKIPLSESSPRRGSHGLFEHRILDDPKDDLSSSKAPQSSSPGLSDPLSKFLKENVEKCFSVYFAFVALSHVTETAVK